MGVESYTLGGHSLVLGGLDVGHVADATVTPNVKALTHFVAREGRQVEDDAVTETLGFTISATLDECSEDNLRAFFMADGLGRVGALSTRRCAAILRGIVIAGVPYTWTIPEVAVKPSGSLSYKLDDWTNFSLILQVRPARAQANPFGTLVCGA